MRDHYRIAHISTGDMLRDRIAAGTPTGLKAKPFVEGGGLVPDRIIIEMVTERLAEPDCSTGFLFDGFPRTIAQAAALNDALRTAHQELDAVVLLEVEDEELVRRLGSRWTCSNADCRPDADIAADGAPVRVLVVRSREDLMIARQVAPFAVG